MVLNHEIYTPTVRSTGQVQFLEISSVIWIHQPQNADDPTIYAHQGHSFTSERYTKMCYIQYGIGMISFRAHIHRKEYFRNFRQTRCNYLNNLL